MGYLYCIVIGLIIGFFVGLWVHWKLKSSANPTVNPMPSGELIEKIVERAIRDYELNKKTDEIIEDINEYLKKGKP